MSEPTIKQLLREIGLSDRASDVYLYLAQHGLQTAANITTGLRMHKAQVYQLLRNLESRGIVETTFKTPRQFTVLPLDQLLKRHIQTKEDELAHFKQYQDGYVLTEWQHLIRSQSPSRVDTFMVLEGRETIHSKIMQLLMEAQREVIGVGNVVDLLRANQDGVIGRANAEATQRDLRYRLILEVSHDHSDSQADLITSFGPQFSVRHRNLSAQFLPRFIVKDGAEAILFLMPFNADRQDYTGLWSNNVAIVHALNVLFEKLWQDSIDLDDKLKVETMTAAFSKNDLDTFLSHVADDAVYVTPAGRRYNKQEMREALLRVQTALPGSWHITRTFTKGNAGMFEWRWRGVHKGTYLGIPATNNPFELTGAMRYEIAADQVEYWQIYMDYRSLEYQLRGGTSPHRVPSSLDGEQHDTTGFRPGK